MEIRPASDQGNEHKFVSMKEAAEALGAHPNTLRRWADAGVLPYYRTPGGQRRFDVETYLTRVRCNARV